MGRGERLHVHRIELLVQNLAAGALEPLAPRPVRLVRDRGPHLAERDALAVHLHLELGLERRELLVVRARDLAEVALAGEAPELAHARVAVDLLPDLARDLRRGQVGVALVDLLQVERLLVPGVVEVVLLVQLRDEAVRLLAVGVQLSRVHPP